MFIVGCVAVYNPATGKKEYYLFDEDAEIKWGQAMAQQFIMENKMVTDPRTISYVQNIGEKIGKNSHRSDLTYHFYIIDKNEINAFAIPGGHVFVYKGLLDKVNRDELAFVLGHEIGHINARHGLKKLGASLGFSILSGILLNDPDQQSVRQLTDQLYNLVSLGYSRSDEYQADSLGLEYVIKSGYNSSCAITLLEKFIDEEKKKGTSYVPVYLRTHPGAGQRIQNIEHKLLELKTLKSSGVNQKPE